MNDQVIELASIKLAAGRTEAQLIEASQAFQNGFLNAQDGFIRRDLVRKSDGNYMDIIHWQSRAHADAILEKAQSSDVVGEFFALMDIDPEKMDEGVEHCTLLGSFTRI
ncbi:MAG: hypothetical protein ACR2RF_20825 [Geminicoccaceae bacterium]